MFEKSMGAKYLAFMCVLCMTAEIAYSATVGTSTVTYTVSAINSISVSGNPGTMTVSSAVAGSNPTSATNASTTYNVTTNQSSQKITASINTYASHVTLSMNLAAPTGATSAGSVALTTTAKNYVTGITKLTSTNRTITYTLAATAAATPQGPLTRTVTFTLGP